MIRFLKFMKKGVSAAVHIEAGQKLIEAGMEVSEYVMPGLGGQAMWREHAIETARVLNQINPHFIRLRSLRVPDRIPLYEKLKDGSFVMQTDDALAEEIRVFIEALDGITSRVSSDHIMNLLEDVSGKLPEDKPAMLKVIQSYQALSEKERTHFPAGQKRRRLSLHRGFQTRFRNASENQPADPGNRGFRRRARGGAVYYRNGGPVYLKPFYYSRFHPAIYSNKISAVVLNRIRLLFQSVHQSGVQTADNPKGRKRKRPAGQPTRRVRLKSFRWKNTRRKC